MFSHFANQSKRSDPEEKLVFRKRVISILRQLYPDYEIKNGNAPDLIQINETQCSLSNIYAKFLLDGGHTHLLRAAVEDHFGKTFKVLDQIPNLGIDWEDAQKVLLPQLMPKRFLEETANVNFPFGRDIVIGTVLETETSYRYVHERELEEWNVDKEEVLEVALENLAKRTEATPMVIWTEDERLVGIETQDSFDAVKIILPDLQRLISKSLGSPFYFIVPNRDFLFCWARDNSEEFHTHTRTRAQIDFNERPYSLSSSVFEANVGGKIKEINQQIFSQRKR